MPPNVASQVVLESRLGKDGTNWRDWHGGSGVRLKLVDSWFKLVVKTPWIYKNR